MRASNNQRFRTLPNVPFRQGAGRLAPALGSATQCRGALPIQPGPKEKPVSHIEQLPIIRVRRNKGTTADRPWSVVDICGKAIDLAEHLALEWGEVVVAERWLNSDRKWSLLHKTRSAAR